MSTLIISIVFFVMILLALKLIISNSDVFFYTFSAVVSLVGINVHYGFTLYLSRVLIILFVVSVLLKLLLNGVVIKKNHFIISFVVLCAAIILEHTVSSLFSERLYDGMRQIFIYIAVMMLFFLIIYNVKKTSTVIKGVNIYLFVGLIQGVYGIYQVVGGPYGWLTYQTIMIGIPTANDRTVDGFLYSGPYSTFRAVGFFPGDVSHYAAYMASIIVLVISLLLYNPRSLYLKAVLVICGAGLILSLSRSGLLGLILFGLPTLLFVILKFKLMPNHYILLYGRYLLGFMIILALIVPQFIEFSNIDGSYLLGVINRRMNDLVNIGADAQGSMGIHILTRLMALDAFMSNPIIGVGLGVNASPWFSELFNAEWAGSHSHHLDILGQTGFLGAILEWFLMWKVGRYMWLGLYVKQAPSHERFLLAGLFSSYILIIFGNFLYHYFLNDFVWYLMGTGVALSRVMLLNSKRNPNFNCMKISSSNLIRL